MKRILAITVTLVLMLAAFTGCRNLPEKGPEPQSMELPVPGEIGDLKINSLDKLNYFAALRAIMGTPTASKQRTTGGSPEIVLLANAAGSDKENVPSLPQTTGPDESGAPSVPPTVPGNAGSDEKIYYYELDPEEPFILRKVSMFQIELTDENGFLASRLGLGRVDVVITEECIWGESLITFRNGENFYSCLSNGWYTDRETGGQMWDFSTHKYVEGFNIVKNFEQENYAFYIGMDAEGQAFSFECREAQNGGYRADQNVKVVSSTGISNQSIRITVAELEEYFKNAGAL